MNVGEIDGAATGIEGGMFGVVGPAGVAALGSRLYELLGKVGLCGFETEEFAPVQSNN